VVWEFIETHQDRRNLEGRRLVVKNGSLPAREILPGVGQAQNLKDLTILAGNEFDDVNLGKKLVTLTEKIEQSAEPDRELPANLATFSAR